MDSGGIGVATFWNTIGLAVVVSLLSGFLVSIASGSEIFALNAGAHAACQAVVHAAQTLLWYRSVDERVYSNCFWWAYLLIGGLFRGILAFLEVRYLPSVFDDIDSISAFIWNAETALATFATNALQFAAAFVLPWYLFAPVNAAWTRRLASSAKQLEHAVVAIRHQY